VSDARYHKRTLTCFGTYFAPTDPLVHKNWVDLGHADGLYYDMDTGSVYRVSYPVVLYIGNIKDLE
jgi:hypothetical protein